MPKILVSAHLLVLGVKLLLIYCLVSSGAASLVGWSSDGDYYNDFALGLINSDPTSYWPVLLRLLDAINLYDRSVVVKALVFANTVLIPYLSYVLSRRLGAGVVYSMIAALFVQIMPANFLISMDIYRDNIFILLALVASLLLAGDARKMGLVPEALMLMALAYVGYLFRPYFGVSLILAYIAVVLSGGHFRVGVLGWFSLSVLGLYFLKYFGLLDSIINYRGVEGFELGGSSFGIGFVGKGFVEFYFLYLLNWIYQFFGFYLSDGFLSLIFFVLESLPLILGFWLYRSEIPALGRCGAFVILFTVIYCAIWVMGNDNFGTAVRLRLPVYVLLYSLLGALIFRGAGRLRYVEIQKQS